MFGTTNLGEAFQDSDLLPLSSVTGHTLTPDDQPEQRQAHQLAL